MGYDLITTRSTTMHRMNDKQRSELGLFLTFLRRRIDGGVLSLGSYVRTPLRVGKRVTQQELAEAIGVTREWYAVLESGSPRAQPSSDLLERLGDALMVTPEERAKLFTLAGPEMSRLHSFRESTAFLEVVSHMRSFSKRLWSATSIEDILTTASEQIADWFDDAVLVRSTRRHELGLWEVRSVSDIQDRSRAAKLAEDMRELLPTRESIDAAYIYPRLASVGDVGTTPEFWPLPLQRKLPKLYARHRVRGFAGLHARARSGTGFIGGFYILHEFGHSYSAADQAVFGAFAEFTSRALS